MPDLMDHVQSMTELHLDNAIATHANRPKPVGLTHCENQDCGEPITKQRQGMGARLCVPCANADEAKAVHFRTWRR